ncbi:unnamed protein product [Anisakis simplex]|uniref:Protein kinase domain-containing protein n=1 Tax=Anisakis simplex TaxID=6269 RepID=A0A3P6SDF1_ANISI|nr:unnamed protein product [Anisakis simplex]
MIFLEHNDAGPVELKIGKVIGKRWQIIEKLGEGGCGSVYKVQDIHTMAKAALKAESNFIAGGSVLKLEVQVLKRLEGRRYVAQLLRSSKKSLYSYMVMTLFGHSLYYLLKHSPYCSTSTQVRVGVNILYGVKQLHEVGFVHRDIKPANLAVGRRGKEIHVIHILDFGLAREFILCNNAGLVEIRAPRRRALFRGTVHYCSLNTHARKEQGRGDDLWSMLYVLAEMKGPLPWERVRGDEQIGKMKRETTDPELFRNSPEELIDDLHAGKGDTSIACAEQIAAHLRTLDYFKRPDYHFIYLKFMDVISKRKYKFSDPYDWEHGEVRHHSRIDAKSTPRTKSKTTTPTGSRESSELKAPATNDDTHGQPDNTAPLSDRSSDSECDLFQEADFEKNELGL